MRSFLRAMTALALIALAFNLLTGCAASPTPTPATTSKNVESAHAPWVIKDDAVRKAVLQKISPETELTVGHQRRIARLTLTDLSSAVSLDELKGFAALTHLQLVGGRLSSKQQDTLAELPRLESLRLSSLGVVNASFLSKMPELKILTLEDLLAVEDFELHPDAKSVTVLFDS